MIGALLIALNIVIYTGQSFFCKKYTDSYKGEPSLASPTFTVVSGAAVVLVSLCFAGFSLTVGWLTALLGVLNGAVLIAYNYFIVRASRLGPYSILMVFNLASGIILPAIVTHFLGDRISFLKMLAILAVVFAVWLVSYRKNEDKPKSKLFIPCCLCLGLSNAAYLILLDLQQRLTGLEEKEGMISITFAVAALSSLVVILVKKRGNLTCFRQTKASALNLATASLAAALAVNILVLVLPLVNTAVLCTLSNAGVFLLSVLCSAVFFHDKLSKINLVGCAGMCVALVSVAIL